MCYWVGVLAIWIFGTVLLSYVLGYLLKLILNKLANVVKLLWQFAEYLYHRRDFKEYIKDKERHPKAV